MNKHERDFKHLLPEEYFFGFNKQGDEDGALIVYENSERSLAREYHWKNGTRSCVGCKNLKKTLIAKVSGNEVSVPKEHACQPEAFEEIKKRQLSYKNISIYGHIGEKELEKYSDISEYKKFEMHEYETPKDGSLVVYADKDKNLIYEFGKLGKKWFCKGCAKLKKKYANVPTQYGGFINMELYLPKKHICRPFYYQISDDSESDEESMVDKLINKYHLKEVNPENIEFCSAMSGRNDKYRMVICSKDRSRVREYHLKPSTDDIWLCKNCEKAEVKDIYAVSKDGVIYAHVNHRCQKIKYSEIVLARRNINNYSIFLKEVARDNDDLEMPLPSNNAASSDSADESPPTTRQQRSRTVGNLEYGRQRSSPVPRSSRTRLHSSNDEHAAAAPIVPNLRTTRSRTEAISRKRSQINGPIAAKSNTTISSSSNSEPMQKRGRVRQPRSPRSRRVEDEDFEDFHVPVQPITSSPIPCSSKTLLYQTNQQAAAAPQIRNTRGPSSRNETIDSYQFEESIDDGNTTVRALQRIFNNSSPQVDSPQPNANLVGTLGNRNLISATRVNFGQGRVDDIASIRRNIGPANIIRIPPRNNGAIRQQPPPPPPSSNILQPINENELIGKVETLASFIEERNENVRNEDQFNENRENEVPVIQTPQNHPNIIQQQNVLDDQNVRQLDEVHNVRMADDGDIQIYAEHIIPASQHLLEQKFKPAAAPEPSFPVNVPTEDFLKIVLKKLKIEFTRLSLNFWSKLLIEEVKNSSIPENSKFFESQTGTFFKCLSLFLTGDAVSYDLNIKIAFQNHIFTNLNSFEPFDGIDFAKMKHTSEEFMKIYTCDEITITHFYLISRWMRCRFFIFVNGGWEKLGSWENENFQMFILQKIASHFYLTTVLLKLHIIAIENHTGEKLTELGFYLFDHQFSAEVCDRIENGLQEACKQLEIGFVSVKF